KSDFDGDGIQDLLVALRLPGFWISLGDGQGGFGAAINNAFAGVGQNTQSIAIGDVNGDARADVVVASSFDGSPSIPPEVSVYLNDGSGGFQFSIPVSFSGMPTAVALGDWSGDGLLDLVVCTVDSSNNSTLRTYTGDGTGHYAAATATALPGQANELALTRMDGDARLDLVAEFSIPRAIAILSGLGAAGFGAPIVYPIGISAYRIAIADANGDGWNDVISGEAGPGGRVMLAFNNGAGGLLPEVTIPVAPSTGGVACQDLDGDGVRDLAVTAFGAAHVGGDVHVLRGLGAGAFASPVTWHAGYAAQAVLVYDLDGDGGRDLLVAKNGGIAGLRALGNGTFLTSSVVSCSSFPDAIALADLDQNGKLDMLVGHSNSVLAFRGNGTGGFGAPTVYATGPMARSIALGDLNGDGKPDLVSADPGAATAKVMLNNGAGALLAPVSFPTGAGAWKVALGDFDRDGRLDLVTVDSAANTVSILIGDGAGGFGPPTSLAVGSMPRSIAVVDLDRDSWPDLVVANNQSTFLSVLRGIGGGAFAPATSVPVGAFQGVVAAGDVNGDAMPDLVYGTAISYSNGLHVLLGNGNGGFPFPSSSVAAMPPAYEIQVEDVDGDGNADICAVGGGYQGIWIARGNGTGFFGKHQSFGTGYTPSSFALGDLNGDDRLDIAVADEFSADVSVLLAHLPYTSLVYCTSKHNSLGCTPQIHFAGTPSAASTSGFTVRSTGVINNKPGLMLYGVSGRAALPFLGGFQCVAAPIRRAVGTSSGGNSPPNDCSGVFALDVNAFAHGLLGGSPLPALTAVGTTVRCQWWGRDPGFAAPNAATLSDALEYRVGP
ncbi:MAG TPA: VCBS repeat-containing protein, partial [Planctomycetota bacterium]|nr:VCBS repeat-containing protein [Planctomycetota bacterium]